MSVGTGLEAVGADGAASGRGRITGLWRGVIVLAAVIGFLVVPRLAAAAPTIVALTFDDGKASQYQVRPVLASHGMRGTFYIISSGAGSSWGMSWAQVQNLANDGNEIGGHTLDHLDLTTLNTTQMTQQICGDRDALVAHGFNAVSFAYPYGAYNSTVEGIVQSCGYESGRGVGGLHNNCGSCPWAETLPPLDRYIIRSAGSPGTSTTLDQMKSWVTDAEQHGGGLVTISFHEICDNACDPYATPLGTISSLLDWLQPRAASGTSVQTMKQALGAQDTTAPTTTVRCNSATCASTAYTAAVSVSLSAVDSGIGVATTRYTTDGSDPTLSSPAYSAPFSVGATTTVKYRTWDAIGNTESVKAQLVTVTIPPPASGGGGGGGGGGAAIPADLKLTGSFDQATVAVGGSLIWRLRVDDVNAGTATGAYVDLTLPAGVEVATATTDRGPGCAKMGALQMRCSLDFLSGQAPVGNVLVIMKVTQAGTLSFSAVTGYPGTDPVPSNNTVAMNAATPVVATPTPTPIPVVVPAPRIKATPAVKRTLTAAGVKATAFSGKLTIDKGARITVTVRSARTGKVVTTLKGSTLGAAKVARPTTALTATTRKAATLQYRLLIGAGKLKAGERCVIVVTATSAAGKKSVAEIRVG